MNVKLSKLVWALVFLISSPALSTTFVVPTDAEMVERAEAIVRGTVISSVATVDSDGRVITTTRLAAEDVLKGNTDAVVEIVEPGGVTAERSSWIYGTPRYTAGERVLVFLDRDSQSRWRTSHMLLGKFAFVPAASGERLLLRGSDEHGVFGVTADGLEHQEFARFEDKFLDFVASSARGGAPVPDYYADQVLQKAWEGRLRVITDAGTDYAMTPAARWNNNATATIPTNLNGAGATRDWVGAAQRGASAWNSDGGSSVNYSISGTSGSSFNQGDGQNIVIFNVPPAEFGSAVGIGGWAGGGSHSFNGESWITITEIDVKINANATSFSQAIIDAVVTHELGHTLGFRHSDQPGRSPSSTNAIMKAVLSGSGGASLGQWDRDALASVYGSGAPVCTPSSIVTGPTASPNPVTAGGNVSLSVNGSGSAPLTYAWFRGSLGDTSNPVGSSQNVNNVGPINAQTTYWVRVTNSCNASGATGAVIVNLAACVPPTINSQPQNRSIIAGQSTTLSVSAGGTGPFTYQWFLGPAGNTSSPITGATNSSLLVSPSATTSYWVRVTSLCPGGPVNSNAATVTVGACVPPSISNQPQSRGINPGQSATLSVGVNGTDPFTFQWFRGQSGDVSNPIAGATSNSVTVNPTVNTSYWVRITNSCSTTPVNSNTATVTINLPCTAAPAITQQPVSQTIDKGATATFSVTATGGGLTYQWFQVAGGNFVLLPGQTASTFTTPALSANASYLVQVSNPCGPSANSQIVNVTIRPDAPAAPTRRRSVRR